MNLPRPPDVELAQLAKEPFEPEEFKCRLALVIAELDGPEGENIHALISWFARPDPTPNDRLKYNARKMRDG